MDGRERITNIHRHVNTHVIRGSRKGDADNNIIIE